MSFPKKNKNNQKADSAKSSFLLLILLAFFLALGAFSVQGVLAYELEVPIGTTTEVTDLPQYISIIYRFAIGVISLLAVLMIVFGGLNWIIAAGNEQRISDAKATIFAAIIGLAIALTSYTLLNTINPNLVALQISVPTITAPTPGTDGAVSGTGEGTCEPCPDDSVCSIANLKGHGFSQEAAEILNQVCYLESSCGTNLISGTDYCIEELHAPWNMSDATRNAPSNFRTDVSVSVGPLQVNLASQGVELPDGRQCKDAFDGYEPFGQGSSGEWGVHCTIKNKSLYDDCKEHFLNADNNLDEAYRKYSDGGLSHWGYSARKCGFDY